MADRECSKSRLGPHAAPIDVLELQGALTLAAILPNDGACWLADAHGRIGLYEYWRRDDADLLARLPSDDRERIGLEYLMFARKIEIRRAAPLT